MAVTRDDVVHIAALARLAMPEGRVPELVEQLNGILSHMDVLQKVDTAGVIGTAGVGDAAAPLRPDVVSPLPLLRPLAEIAPEWRDGFFLVPRLATHEDAAGAEAEEDA
ncbi:MAG TPA: Asp-tRNA(Asn)/Glu-tRNA(Gln) amidotransferase subunit GatC [Gemmatimonadaceae bacterium]|nr:Asp-tRNA(Asn)/Glu-tRNA(Gln) amidotransferase subunit GatC [Gemmatimonadaceae bacterium]